MQTLIQIQQDSMSGKLASKRSLQIIFALIGFAFLAEMVLITNDLTGYPFKDPQAQKAFITAGADFYVFWIFYQAFINPLQKFLLPFALGCLFYFYLNQPALKSSAKKFSLSLLFLFAIGIMHGLFLYPGDHLKYYAIGALLLLLFRNSSMTVLLISGIVLAFIVPALPRIIKSLITLPLLYSVDFKKFLSLVLSHSYADMIRANWLATLHAFADLHNMMRYLLAPLGGMLLGYWFIKINWMERLMYNENFFKKFLLICSIPGTALTLFFTVYTLTTDGRIGAGLALPFILAQITMGLTYLCLIVWLLRDRVIKGFTSLLIVAGQLPLTIYILQSLFAMLLFSNAFMGLGNYIGPTLIFPIAFIMIYMQLLAGRWWLKHFTAGPLEYIWLSIIRSEKGQQSRIKKKNFKAVPVKNFKQLYK